MLRWIFCAALVLATAAGASAQPAKPDLAEAASLYRAAEQAMTERRYDDAARDYGAAYEISKDAVLFFKIGSALDKGGKCPVAVTYYRRYLREAKPTAEHQKLTNERIAVCEGTRKPEGGADAGGASGEKVGDKAGDKPKGEADKSGEKKPEGAKPTEQMKPSSASGEGAAGPGTGGTGGGTTGSTGTTGTTGDTGSSSGSSSGGPVCSADGASCAKGELCCDGLDCCAGIPVPPGKEFCSASCPISDRNLKTEFAAIDPAQVLSRVVELPISTWRYRKDGAEVRHLGPMAQDFHAAFGLWNSDTMIFPLDGSGVSMAAIQGLHARVVAAEAENEALRARLERLERRLGE